LCVKSLKSTFLTGESLWRNSPKLTEYAFKSMYIYVYFYGMSIHTAGRMHNIGDSMHTAGFGMIFYLLI